MYSIYYTHCNKCNTNKFKCKATSNIVQVAVVLALWSWPRKRRKPSDGKPPKNRLNTFPTRLFHPASLLFLKLLNAGLIVPNSLNLSAKHNRCEHGE